MILGHEGEIEISKSERVFFVGGFWEGCDFYMFYVGGDEFALNFFKRATNRPSIIVYRLSKLYRQSSVVCHLSLAVCRFCFGFALGPGPRVFLFVLVSFVGCLGLFKGFFKESLQDASAVFEPWKRDDSQELIMISSYAYGGGGGGRDTVGGNRGDDQKSYAIPLRFHFLMDTAAWLSGRPAIRPYGLTVRQYTS